MSWLLNVLKSGGGPENTTAVLDVPPVPMYDWRQLKHWNLSVDAVSKGSIVINRELTLWDFRYYIVGGLAFLLAQSILIAALLAQKRRRKSAEETLKERLEFEALLSNLSARFVNLPPEDVDREIERALKAILDFFQVDRCGLVRTLPGRAAYQITHAAYSEDVPPVPAGSEIPISLNPWAYEKMILKREVVAFSRIDDLPPEAAVDKQTWTEWGIRSNVNIPILVGEPVDHIIAINSVKSERVWPEELFPRLQLLGEIFVNALERKRRQLELGGTPAIRTFHLRPLGPFRKHCGRRDRRGNHRLAEADHRVLPGGADQPGVVFGRRDPSGPGL